MKGNIVKCCTSLHLKNCQIFDYKSWQTEELLQPEQSWLDRSIAHAPCVCKFFMPRWLFILPGSCHLSPTLFDAALGDAKHVDDISWDQYHGRQSHEPANHLTPQRVHILPQGQRGHLNGTEGKHPQANQRSEEHPAELPPATWPIANHVLNVLIKPFSSIKPGYGNSFEEDEEEETHPTGGVVIKQLEHVQATLCDVGEADDEGDEADNEDEDLLPLPQL